MEVPESVTVLFVGRIRSRALLSIVATLFFLSFVSFGAQSWLSWPTFARQPRQRFFYSLTSTYAAILLLGFIMSVMAAIKPFTKGVKVIRMIAGFETLYIFFSVLTSAIITYTGVGELPGVFIVPVAFIALPIPVFCGVAFYILSKIENSVEPTFDVSTIDFALHPSKIAPRMDGVVDEDNILLTPIRWGAGPCATWRLRTRLLLNSIGFFLFFLRLVGELVVSLTWLTVRDTHGIDAVVHLALPCLVAGTSGLLSWRNNSSRLFFVRSMKWSAVIVLLLAISAVYDVVLLYFTTAHIGRSFIIATWIPLANLAITIFLAFTTTLFTSLAEDLITAHRDSDDKKRLLDGDKY